MLIVEGMLIGLGAAAPLGPVNVEIARRTLRGGFGAGVALGAGAVSVDVAYATATSFSVGRALDRPAIAATLAVLSVALLGWMGFQCLRAAWRGSTDAPDLGGEPRTAGPTAVRRGRNGFVAGLLMTLVNPMTLVFWFTTLPTVAGPIDPHGLPKVALGIFLGTFSWVLAFAATLAWLGRFQRGAWLRVVDAAGGVTLIAFAAAAFLRSIRPHL